ncbi:MAG: hypothetical protein AB1777_02060 [Bacteroidota bacterium]
MLAAVFYGCEKEPLHQEPNTPKEASAEGMIKLGKRLENPFTVENMQKAYNNLVKQGAVKSGLEISPTHQYIRFLPSDMEQFDQLELDTLNAMFDYPLDYEIEEGGTYYYDPELNPEVNPYSWQYVVLPINKPVPNIPHEKIADLVLDISAVEKSPERAAALWDMLETEALRLTGNLNEKESATKGRWTPSGRITVWDDVVGRQIPLQGVKVRARWWFFWETGFTDSNGDYTVSGTFKGGRKVNYSIIWERSNWDIREEDWGQAYYNGPKKDTEWNLDITSDKSLRYATIHRALLNYYYGDRLGLRIPYSPSALKPKLKVGYYHHDHWRDINGSAVPFRENLTIPHVCIYGKDGSGSWSTTDFIYATTCHEVAHVSHWEMVGEGAFALIWLNPKTRIVPESWAVAVSWQLTRNEYSRFGNFALNYIDFYFNKQQWNNSNDKCYTPFFIDLIDNINQRVQHAGSSSYPNDNVTGYTVAKLEQLLYAFRDLDLLEATLLVNKPSGVTNESIKELVSFYKNL